MNTSRTLFHLMRADFFERARRYSFLITLGLTVFTAYLYMPPASANYLTLGLGNYRGVYNSAWVGGAIAVLCSTLLSLPAFYLVKNAIERDEQTGVGQIITTTPLSKPLYTLGKAFSNFVFLAVMVGVIAFAAGVMQLIRGEVFRIDLWALLSPFLFSVLPAMAMIAALAVLFETILWLRGTFGNVVYFILWLVLLIVSAASMPSPQRVGEPGTDLWGIQIIISSMMNDTAIGMAILPVPLQTFTREGIHWTGKIIFGRIVWLIAAIGISLLAALIFRRFDPAPQKPRLTRDTESFALSSLESVPRPPTPASIHLTPLASSRSAFYPLRILLAELRLLFKGIRWWSILFIGLNVVGLLLPAKAARQYLLPVLWILPLALWSALGTRGQHHNTNQLVFSAPHPISRQFPLAWLAGVIVTLVTGAGVGINLAMSGEWLSLMAWGVGAFFIPTLAITLGIWSGTNKLFEVVYILWWYVGPLNRLESLDFMGADTNLHVKNIMIYGLITILLFVLAMFGRKRQIKR